MRGHTHIAGGVALATLTAVYFNKMQIPISPGNLAILATYEGAAVVGSLLPDIDIKGSKISNKNRIASFIVRTFFGHRGFTHSLLCFALLSVLIFAFGGLVPYGQGNNVLYGFMCGYISHLFLDMLNPKGIPLLYPYKHMISICRIKTGGLLEQFVFVGLSVLTVWGMKGMIILR